MPETDRQIAERAYALWEKEGRPHGRDVEHWSQAEHDVGMNGAGDQKSGAAASDTAGAVASADGEAIPVPKDGAVAPAPTAKKPRARRAASPAQPDVPPAEPEATPAAKPAAPSRSRAKRTAE